MAGWTPDGHADDIPQVVARCRDRRDSTRWQERALVGRVRRRQPADLVVVGSTMVASGHRDEQTVPAYLRTLYLCPYVPHGLLGMILITMRNHTESCSYCIYYSRGLHTHKSLVNSCHRKL